MGMAQALGVRFFDTEDRKLPKGGLSLSKISRIDITQIDNRIKDTHFEALCDVSNPLTGPSGAVLVYGPQKGASGETIKILEEGMINYASIIQKDLKIALDQTRGAGAAGGTAAGMKAFLNAKLNPGSETILNLIDWEKHLKDADLVLTGEGRLDIQTCFDKSPIVVAKRAKNKGIPVIAIPGILGDGYEQTLLHGIDAIIPISFSKLLTIPENSDVLISKAVEQALRCWQLSHKVSKC